MSKFNPAYDVAVLDADDILPPPPPTAEKRKKKKRGAFGIFRAALSILRKRTDEKEDAAAKTRKDERSNGGGGDWRDIVQSMRPLHVPSGGFGGSASPAPSCSGSSCGTMSRYASAANLRDLDEEEQQRDPDEVFDAIDGDDAIDAKAEEFISRFYKSIHHQNSIHHQDRGV